MSYIRELYLRLCMSSVFRAVISKPLFASFANYAKSTVADEKIKGSTRSYVKISVEDQFLSISSSSVNGKVFDEMDCVHEGSDIEIGFNCRYLINSVKVSEGENIKLSLKSPTQAITIEATEESDDFKYFYMILPVRMNDQR